MAKMAREAPASMADIVWAVNPQKDSLGDLVARVRRFCAEVLEAQGIDCRVIAPESDFGLKLGVETRRQLLLFIKEAIHNIARHARCTQAAVEIHEAIGQSDTVQNGRRAPRLRFSRQCPMLLVRISDNGVGFDPRRSVEGNGLQNMRARAARLGAGMLIDSEDGKGTTLEVRLPSGKPSPPSF
jgi:signal transduction histidine kinase